MNNNRIFKAKWIICIISGLFFFYTFMQMNFLNPITPILINQFGYSVKYISVLSLVFFVLNALFILPAGYILIRFKLKNVILLAFSFSLIGVFLINMQINYSNFLIYRALCGISNAFAFLSCVAIAAKELDKTYLSIITSLYFLLALIGGLVSQYPIDYLVHHYTLKVAIRCNLSLGIVIIMLLWIFLPYYEDKPRTGGNTILKEFKKKILYTAKQKINWELGISATAINLPVALWGSTWGIHYLRHFGAAIQKHSSLIVSMMFAGFMFSTPLIGWLLKSRMSHSMAKLIGLVVLGLTSFILAICHINNLISFYIIFFLIGMGASTQISPFSLAAEIQTEKNISTAFVSIIVMALSGLLQPIYAVLMEHEHIMNVNLEPYLLLITTSATAFYIFIVSKRRDAKLSGKAALE